MKNKSLLLKLWAMVIAMGGFGLCFTSAATIFHLNIEWIKASATKNITDKMMYVHFADNDNNFGWFLYFSNGSWDDESEDLYWVQANSDVYNCRTKIKWFYYNAERWERLWPLDSETWSGVLKNTWLTTEGWIYVNCVKTWYVQALNACWDPDKEKENYKVCEEQVKSDFKILGFGYYGSVDQTYSWQKLNLTVWVKYKTNNGNGKFISIDPNSGLSPTFENLDNQIPVWFVYDYNGWVGLAWCRFNNLRFGKDSMKKLIDEAGWNLSKIFKYDTSSRTLLYHWSVFQTSEPKDIICEPISVADTLLRIVVEWIVGMNDGWDEWDTKFWSIGNSSDTKMQYFGTKTVSTATLMNYAIKKAELLCRWKWGHNSTAFSAGNKDKLVCWDDSTISAERATAARNNWKTLIVKNWTVTIVPETWSNNPGYYDITILNGDLSINESGAKSFVINKGWFVSNIPVETFSGEVHNALCPVWGSECNWSYDWSYGAAVWSFIKWNLIVNGKIKWSDGVLLKNKYFVYGKLASKDDFNDLETTFSWTCENWFGKDGNYCPDGNQDRRNPYRNAALVVIDQNYWSPLLK